MGAVSRERIACGDWGEAANLEMSYTHSRIGATLRITEAVRVPRDNPFELRVGKEHRGSIDDIPPHSQARLDSLSTFA